MRLRNKLLSLVAGALALVGVSGPAHALGIPVTLTSLIGGGTLTSEDGKLTFSNFNAVISGKISGNTDDYLVQALGTGFRITGAFIVADGNVGDMVLGYTVTATPPLQIIGAKLFSNATFNPDPAPSGVAAGVSETLFSNNNFLGIMSVAASSGGLSDLNDSLDFAGVASLDVLKDIALTTGLDAAAVSHISIVDQTFTVTPEPGTLLLGSIGLAGLAAVGRKRAR